MADGRHSEKRCNWSLLSKWSTGYLLKKELSPFPFPYNADKPLHEIVENLDRILQRHDRSDCSNGAPADPEPPRRGNCRPFMCLFDDLDSGDLDCGCHPSFCLNQPLMEGTAGVLTFNALHSDYMRKGRLRDGLGLSYSIYQRALRHQLKLFEEIEKFEEAETPKNPRKLRLSRLHKGVFLYSIYQLFKELRWSWHARQYLLLSLVENAITYFLTREPFESETTSAFDYYAERSGSYQVLSRDLGVPNSEIVDVCNEIGALLVGKSKKAWIAEHVAEHVKKGEEAREWALKKALPPDLKDLGKNPGRGQSAKRDQSTEGWPPWMILFPEWILGRLEHRPWFRCDPCADELNENHVNATYVERLFNEIEKKPERWAFYEEFARYLMSTIPGFRTKWNVHNSGGQVDVSVVREGVAYDFRDECSRTILCECKLTTRSVGNEEVAYFGSKLRNAQSNFGVLFTGKLGASGAGGQRVKYAQRELTLLVHREGIVIAVVTIDELETMKKELCETRERGGDFSGKCSFLNLLRAKYEEVRMM